jgi:metallo-beta-lactamase family protein
MTNEISIQFLGAASTVTGSKHLLKTPGKNILIDCGLFQGIKSLRLKNWAPLPVSVDQIDTVIITHAHLDHCGYIPLLVKSGFKGNILMTAPTRDLVEIILRDSAKIQEEDADRANKYGYSKHTPALPLYTTADVEKSLALFKTYTDKESVSLSPNIHFQFLKNGHILGSCFIEMDCYGKKIIFTGDIGRIKSELLAPPTIIEDADFIVMESTYGNRLHSNANVADELSDVINSTIHRSGNLLIPSFAVGRAQELMHMILQLKRALNIPDIPVFMDSPMGADATEILNKYPDWHKLTAEDSKALHDNITIIKDWHDTQKVIDAKGSKIVIAASGMLTGGRVLEYLKHYIGNKRNTVMLVGYQAEGTRGRALREGVHEIKIHGKYYKVQAHVCEITSLSAHGDQQEMLDWLKQFKQKPSRIFLVHGEPMVQQAFRVKIEDELKIDTVIPLQNEEYTLFKIA